MWQTEQPRKIFVYTEPTDMRKSFLGLLVLVQRIFKDEDPYSGSLFVFVNRRGNYVKILMWDRTGFSLLAKKLHLSWKLSSARAFRKSTSLHFGWHTSWRQATLVVCKSHDPG